MIYFIVALRGMYFNILKYLYRLVRLGIVSLRSRVHACETIRVSEVVVPGAGSEPACRRMLKDIFIPFGAR